MTGRGHHHGVHHEAEDDGRGRQQHVIQEAGRRSEPAAFPVFREVNAGENTDRRADQRTEGRHEDRTHDRGLQAARGSRGRRFFREERERHRADTVLDEGHEDPHVGTGVSASSFASITVADAVRLALLTLRCPTMTVS